MCMQHWAGYYPCSTLFLIFLWTSSKINPLPSNLIHSYPIRIVFLYLDYSSSSSGFSPLRKALISSNDLGVVFNLLDLLHMLFVASTLSIFPASEEFSRATLINYDKPGRELLTTTGKEKSFDKQFCYLNWSLPDSSLHSMLLPFLHPYVPE